MRDTAPIYLSWHQIASCNKALRCLDRNQIKIFKIRRQNFISSANLGQCKIFQSLFTHSIWPWWTHSSIWCMTLTTKEIIQGQVWILVQMKASRQLPRHPKKYLKCKFGIDAHLDASLMTWKRPTTIAKSWLGQNVWQKCAFLAVWSRISEDANLTQCAKMGTVCMEKKICKDIKSSSFFRNGNDIC